MEKKQIELKDLVKNKYGEIAKKSNETNKSSCCCSSSCCGSNNSTYNVFSEKYDDLKGYNPDADLALGCGLPTEFANINEGDFVLDLGSGAGNDCFVAHSLVGENGFVTGLDFTDEMIEKANKNKEKLAYNNIEFIKGDIEDMPFSNNNFDVVVSNCVLNLVPNKIKAFNEIFRVLKSNGHFCVSDVVIKGDLPENITSDAEMYAGCVAGAIKLEDYIKIVEDAGFVDITIHKEKIIELPTELLQKYLNENEIKQFETGINGILSATISAIKPL